MCVSPTWRMRWQFFLSVAVCVYCTRLCRLTRAASLAISLCLCLNLRAWLPYDGFFLSFCVCVWMRGNEQRAWRVLGDAQHVADEQQQLSVDCQVAGLG